MKNELNLIDKMEATQNAITEAMIVEYRKIKQALGNRPLGGRPRTPAERLAYYDTIKNDPDEWEKIIQQSGSGEALKFAVEMERLRTKQQPEQEPTEWPKQ